jgi:hypothetical protein
MTKLARAALVALAVAATGCASLHAGSDPAGPPLATPLPPPHTIPAVENDAAPPVPPAASGPTPVVVRPARRVPAPKPDKTSDKASDKTEAAPPAAVPAPPQANAPLPPLQTTANVTEVEKNIRARIARATRDLDRTDYRALSTERRTEYDTAKRFIEQAEDALKVKNLVFAGQLADKAATLAAALVQK